MDKPSEIVDVGDKLWVKLIGREMKNDRIKVSLSMKVVNQGTVKDVDPNNVIIEQEERRRWSFQDYTGQRITLEAPKCSLTVHPHPGGVPMHPELGLLSLDHK